MAARLVDVAGPLFAHHGFAAVGVERIVKAAGVGKATLYKHYATKDDLIVAWLRREEARALARVADWAGGDDRQPLEQLRGYFAGLATFATSADCFGCPFQMAAAEFPDEASGPHRAASSHKAALLFRFRRLCRAAGLAEPESVARQLLLVSDGAYAAARIFPGKNPGADVARAAEAILASASR